jgi:hypothetical protein
MEPNKIKTHLYLLPILNYLFYPENPNTKIVCLPDFFFPQIIEAINNNKVPILYSKEHTKNAVNIISKFILKNINDESLYIFVDKIIIKELKNHFNCYPYNDNNESSKLYFVDKKVDGYFIKNIQKNEIIRNLN